MHQHLGQIQFNIFLIVCGICFTGGSALRAESFAPPKALPTLNLQDLPANLFQIAVCDQDIADNSARLWADRQRSNSGQPSQTATFCFTRINPTQDEFILGTIINYPYHLRPPTSITSESALKGQNELNLGLDSQVLASILDGINLRYNQPFTWVRLESSRINDLGDNGYSLSAQGNSRNGTYRYFQIIVFSRQDVLVILVTSYSSMSAPVINMIELAHRLDQRLTKWLIN